MKMSDTEPTFFLASNLMDLLKCADPVKCISAHGHSSNGATMKSMRRCYNMKRVILVKELIFGFEVLRINFLYFGRLPLVQLETNDSIYSISSHPASLGPRSAPADN